MKIVCICDTGVVVSLMIALKVKQAVRDLGISANIDYLELNTLPSVDADFYVLSETNGAAREIQKISKDKVITLERILDKEEIKAKLKARLDL